MSIINFIIILFGLVFSKELIAANEERIIVSSLVLILILSLELLDEVVKDELNNNITSIYEEIRSSMVIYYSIIKAFERLTFKRNRFLINFHLGLSIGLNNLKDLFVEWSIFSIRLMRLIEYGILKYQLQLN